MFESDGVRTSVDYLGSSMPDICTPIGAVRTLYMFRLKTKGLRKLRGVSLVDAHKVE